jgi:hypothetical protein
VRAVKLQVRLHGLQPFASACVSIVVAKVSSLGLQPFVDVACVFHASASALDNGTDPALGSIDMLDALIHGEEQLFLLVLELGHGPLKVRYGSLERMRLEGALDGAL